MQLKTRRPRRLDQRRMLSGSERPVDEMQSRPLTLLDDLLGRFAARRVVSSSEVVDLLLDLRSAIVFDVAFTSLRVEMEDQ
jgi:hypothetical protein